MDTQLHFHNILLMLRWGDIKIFMDNNDYPERNSLQNYNIFSKYMKKCKKSYFPLLSLYSKMGVPMQPLGAWMWSIAQTVAAMSVMWVSREVSPEVTCHPMKMRGMWESLWLQVP